MKLIFEKVDVESYDAQVLLKELNEVLVGILGHNGTAHVSYDDFEHEKAFFLVGYKDGEPCCCAGLRRINDETGEVKRVFARRNREGVGAALMEAVEANAQALGYCHLVLECRSGNPHAIEFYRKIGYAICDNYPPYDVEEDAVCLKKDL